LANEQSWRTAWRTRSLLSRTNTSRATNASWSDEPLLFDGADDPRRRALPSAAQAWSRASARMPSRPSRRPAELAEYVAEPGAVAEPLELRTERRAVRPILRTRDVPHVCLPAARIAPALEARPPPRPTAGGYSSRSKPSRIGTSRNSRSRRSSAPGRFTTNRSGQPRRATARRKCRRMFGYSAALKMSRCTPSGRTHSRAARSRSSPVVAVGQHATARAANVTANSLRTRASLAATPVGARSSRPCDSHTALILRAVPKKARKRPQTTDR
jgi:hypothetical protein